MPGYYNNFNNNNNSNRGGGQRNGGYNNQSGGQRNSGFSNRNSDSFDLTPMPLPDDYVDFAQRVMGEHKNDRNRITTTKIRSILSMVSDIFNDENRRKEDKLSQSSMSKLQLLRIRMIYECGRYPTDVRPFFEYTKLINYLLDIGDSRQKFIHYTRYMEALVAYHRFYGGRDN